MALRIGSFMMMMIIEWNFVWFFFLGIVFGGVCWCFLWVVFWWWDVVGGVMWMSMFVVVGLWVLGGGF